MKRIKRVLLLLFAGFLAFAPPGTLIVSFILLVGLFRNRPFVVVGILALAAAAAAWLFLRKLSARRIKLRERDASRD